VTFLLEHRHCTVQWVATELWELHPSAGPMETGTHLLSYMASYPKWPKYSSPVWKTHFIHLKKTILHQQFVGQDISDGIATRYGLDGPGIESRLGGEILHSRPDCLWGPLNILYNGYRVFRGVKAAGTWRWTLTPSTAEVKERVALYLYFSLVLPGLF